MKKKNNRENVRGDNRRKHGDLGSRQPGNSLGLMRSLKKAVGEAETQPVSHHTLLAGTLADSARCP